MATADPAAISSLNCHLGGLTRVAFSPDGQTIFTGGTDSLVRIHRVSEPDSEPDFLDNHHDAVTSLAASKTHLITASVDNIARIFTYPDNEFSGYLTRSSGVPIRWVSIDPQGERVAVCSDDLLVKIVNIRDTTRVALLSDNVKPLRSAAWDPSGKYLITAGCDGKLKVYDTASSTPVNIKIIDGMISPSESDASTSAYVSWHPAGNFFAVPLRNNDIGIIHKEGWSKQATFSHDGHQGPVTELAWSPNGKYLASSSGTQLLVWSTEKREVVARFEHDAGAVSGLAWSPKANLLAFTTVDGSYNRWADPVPSDLPSPYLSEAAQAKRVEKLLDDGIFGDDDDGDLEDKGEDLGDDLMEDDWIIDDDGAYAGAEDDGEAKWTAGKTEVVNVTKAQEAFVPGSTAWRSKKRYLAFNMIGMVDATDQETHNVVNVEFHDKSARRGYHFSDATKYTMASLGEQGIVYAAPRDGTQPSVVHYRPYDSWASSSDWTLPLLEGEDAVAVAAGGPAAGLGAVVVATSAGYIRFFTASGIQRYVWRLGEEVVTMAAGKEYVAIVHREGGTSLDGCQNLRYSLLDLDNFDLLQEGRVPLPRKTQLSWVGFTADGAPVMYDSTGLLSVLDRFRRPGQARWVPLLDAAALAKGKQEKYWPVGVSETKFACIILRGIEKEPWFPPPLIQELDLKMPLLGTDNAQGKLEESITRNSVQLSLYGADSDREVAIDRELLVAIQGACKADQLARALDLARLMNNTSSLDAAIKIAGFYHLPGLQERIGHIKEGKGRSSHKRRLSHGASRWEPAPRPPAPIHDTPSRSKERQFSDFAPSSRRRTFGGRTGPEPVRAETPVSTRKSFVPETPGDDEDMDDEVEGTVDNEVGVDAETDESLPTSPFKKRRRSPEFDTFAAPAKPEGPKNPFAKKPPGSNPFAKPAVAKPLDSVKSTSFFERVDTIEGAKGGKPKAKAVPLPTKASGKQTTLFGFPPSSNSQRRPAIKQRESILTETETETETEDERVRGHGSGPLEETQVQETLEETQTDD
ncbi:DNA polymerase alpha accessory factor Mcl1 [Vanrija albida]|uniref:DNA polymerase alpha accessory factor Mcl1 n=1 Tax=Vanrija albida TaxID=181172 RepID=A0ABR3QAH0_9TREE